MHSRFGIQKRSTMKRICPAARYVGASLIIIILIGCVMLLSACHQRSNAGLNVDESAAVVASTSQICDLNSANIPVVAAAPNDGYLRYVTWYARPIVNKDLPWLIGFSGGNREKIDFERNQAIGVATGRMMEIPGRADAVTTPDGRFFTVPPFYSQDKGNTFDIYRTGDLLAKWQTGATSAIDIPRIAVLEFGSWYQSLSFPLNGEDGSGNYVHRAVVSEAGQSGFKLVEFTIIAEGPVATPRQAKLCNSDDHQTVMLSKTGRYVSAYDTHSGTTKIYALTPHWERTPPSVDCDTVIDFGFAAGKGDFNFDDSMIAFHVNFMSSPEDGEDGTSYVHEIGPQQTKDAVVVKFSKVDGSINGVDRIARLSTSQQKGSGSYFPAFLPDKHVFFIHNEAGKGYKFYVVDPVKAVWSANIFKPRNAQFARTAAIGKLWAASCKTWSLQDEEAAWYYLSLTRDQCNALVTERWDDYRQRIDPNLQGAQLAEACNAKS